MSNPMQPLIVDEEGTVRFKSNKIVLYLLDNGPFDMNDILKLFVFEPFSRDDLEQFYQLIGYSVGGYSELSYVSDRSYNMAERRARKLLGGEV